MKNHYKPYTKTHTLRISFCIALLFVASLTYSQVVRYSNDFLRIGLGADAIAQSGAVVSNSNNVAAGFWNPARIINIKSRYDIASMHAEYFYGMAQYDYLGGSYKLADGSAIALNIIRFGVDDIQNTLELFDAQGNIDYNRITKFSVADYAFLASYARQLPIKGLSVGGSLKVLYRDQGGFATAWGMGLDLAASYKMGKWQFGAILRDASTTTTTWSFNEESLRVPYDTLGLSNPIPEENLEVSLPSLTIGASRDFLLWPKWLLRTAIDADVFFDGERNTYVTSSFASMNLKTGIELSYAQLVFLRTGAGNFQKLEDFSGNEKFRFSPSVGLGLHYWGFSLDYALGNIAGFGGGQFSNYFSLRYSFD